MNNKLAKKIQFGGWDKNDYKQIRRKINQYEAYHEHKNNLQYKEETPNNREDEAICSICIRES